MFSINVKTSQGAVHRISVRPQDTCLQLASKVSTTVGIDLNVVRLIYLTRDITDEAIKNKTLLQMGFVREKPYL